MIKHLTISLVLCALADFACSTHNRDNETAAEPTADEGACEIPASFTASPYASVPDVSCESGEVTVQLFEVTIELEKDGSIRARVVTKLKNLGATPATAAVGYLLSTPVGRKNRIEQITFGGQNSSPSEIRTCEKKSPSNLVRPYTASAKWARTALGPGDLGQVEISYVATAEPTATPMTLFGYRDLFALNWNNWSWSYKKCREFKEIANELGLFYGAFKLGDADETRVSIHASSDSGGLRGLSHEQNLEETEKAGAYNLRFGRDDRPRELEFEFSSGAVSAAREIEVYSRMAAARPSDLRAAIHLADLYLLTGAGEKRLNLLTDLLAKWDSNANEQLIKGRNDLEPAAYVALVRTLSGLGLEYRAREEAQKSLRLEDRLLSDENDAPDERSKLAIEWLRRMATLRPAR